MKTILPFVFYFILFNSFSQNSTNTIKGIITHGDYPLVNANIAIKGTAEGIQTDKNGTYEIEAQPRDVLVFSYVGMQTFEIVVEDVTRILNINMVRKVEKLDEVVVTKRKRMTQKTMAIEYRNNKSVINSAFGYLNKETAAFSLAVIDGGELNDASIDLFSALNGKSSGVFTSDWYNSGTGVSEPRVFIRGGKVPALIDLDGLIMTRAPSGLNVNIVERVGIVKGLSAVQRYGFIARGGVLIINTKNNNPSVLEKGSSRPYDQAKLRNNIFNNDALSQALVLKNEALYLKELYQSKTKEEALAIYKKHRGNYGDSYYFVIDTYRLFMTRFNETGIANGIITAHEDLFKENPVALKALAYVYQTNGDFKKANELYKEIFIQRPNYGQSYMDLANSYRELGDGKKATSLYMRYDYLVNEGFLENDSTAFAKIMDRELNNLIAVGGRDILSKRDFKKAVLEEDFNGTRLVFEWNDSEAEFELQFVNPEGRYFKTVHSLAKDAERIRDEKLLGYSCEEFLIDESLTGTWKVNANYLGNKSLTPSYLKATIYYDYGSAAQRKEIKVFKLGIKNVNQELFKVSNVGKVASN